METGPTYGENFKDKSILYFDFHYDLYSDTMKHALKYHLKLRDFHHKPHRLEALIIFCNEIAKTVNASLLSRNESTKRWVDLGSQEIEKYPTIIPLVASRDINISAHSMWRKFRNYKNPKLLPRLHQVDSLPQNFVYCGIPTQNEGSSFAICMFFHPFDNWICLVIVSAFTFITLIINLNSKSEMTFTTTLTVTFAAMILINGCTKSSHKYFKYSTLLILWIFSSQVTYLFYCGIMTGHLTRPQPDETLKTPEDLLQANYTVIYTRTGLLLNEDRERARIMNDITMVNLLKRAVVIEDKSSFMEQLCMFWRENGAFLCVECDSTNSNTSSGNDFKGIYCSKRLS